MPMPPEKRYIAYMLRLWRVNGAGLPDWQASLEDPHNGKQIGFADLLSLFSYLKDQTGTDRENDEVPEDK
jgi:hypothetical protein